jgi:hypothetical protein
MIGFHRRTIDAGRFCVVDDGALRKKASTAACKSAALMAFFYRSTIGASAHF